ncbi:MAG TPA: type II secretion system F family protein [Flavisolibacter sp.]|jgi:type IV pilus assembly protein PilC
MSETIDIRKIRRRTAASEKTVKEQKDIWAFLNRDISLFGSALPDKIRESFYLELGTLLEAGVDIRSALELIRLEFKKKKHQAIFNRLLQKIIAGATLSGALHDAGVFSVYEQHTVQIGEETGKLASVLKDLAVFFNKRIKQRRQIIGALMYPVMVLSVSFAAIIFMVSYVVPMFSDMYQRSGDDLPGITKFVIAFSQAVKTFSPLFFFLLVSLVLVSFWQRKNPRFRSLSASVLLRIPVWGGLVKKIYLARLTGTMAMLLGARVPMQQAIRLTRQIITFYPFEKALEKTEESITRGESLNKALERHPVFPPKLIVMARVGEEVNELEMFFRQLAEQYNHEIEHQTTLLSKFIEPLIIIILGVVVGVILIAMYLPLFKLGQQF